MTSVRSVDHVQLPVPVGGSKQARVFYEELLGLRELRDPARDRPGSLHYALGWGRLDLREGMYSGVAPQARMRAADRLVDPVDDVEKGDAVAAVMSQFVGGIGAPADRDRALGKAPR